MINIYSLFPSKRISILKYLTVCKHTRILPMAKVPEAVQEAQWMDSVKQRVRNISKGRMLSLELWDEKEGEQEINNKIIHLLQNLIPQTGSTPRYALTIVDNKAAQIPQQQSKCAVFVVPIGREHEWLFSSEEGQFQVIFLYFICCLYDFDINIPL